MIEFDAIFFHNSDGLVVLAIFSSEFFSFFVPDMCIGTSENKHDKCGICVEKERHFRKLKLI